MFQNKAVLCASLIFALSQGAMADVFSVNPAAAYLHTNSDAAPNALVINLSSLSFTVHDGDILHLASTGFFIPSSGATQDSESLLGVFSSTNTLLTSDNLNRVTGAIAAGVPFVTDPTFTGNQATDIPQDFLIDSGGALHTEVNPAFSSIDVQVPVGAHFLFVTSYDSHYSDNTDPNNDFGVVITQTPEPGSLMLLGLACPMLFRRSKKVRA